MFDDFAVFPMNLYGILDPPFINPDPTLRSSNQLNSGNLGIIKRATNTKQVRMMSKNLIFKLSHTFSYFLHIVSVLLLIPDSQSQAAWEMIKIITLPRCI